jgi:putative ABC transport system permease protein
MTDPRYAFRTLRRTPGVTAVAVIALALGIGANSAIFSVVYAALLRPLPIRDASRVVAINAYNPKFNIPPIQPGYAVYNIWKEQAGSFEALAASWSGVAELDNEKVPHWRVSASFFPTLGVQPALGRAFSDEDDRAGGPNLVLVSHEFWVNRFGRDRAIAGKGVKLNGEAYTVVGVMPRGFEIDGKPAQVYTAIRQDPTDKRYLPVNAYARLRPGVSIAQAQAEIDGIEARRDVRGSGWKARVWSLRQSMIRDLRQSLIVLFGAVGLVLLIACANVASILLARSSARQQEVAIRTALGAPRGRLVRQFLIESALLGGAGAAAGLALAVLAMRLVPALDSERLPNILLATRIDAGVLGFTALIAIATIVVFGLAPAFSAAPVRVNDRRTDTRRGKRVWNALIVSETALALVLLIGATMLIRSFIFLRDTAPGFRADGLLTLSLTAPKGQDPAPFYQGSLEKARAVPGVASATLASALPLDGDYRSMSMRIEGHQVTRPQDMPILWHRQIEADYFKTLGIPIRQGRAFTAQDREAVIVNETFARRFWPGQDPIGKHVGPLPVVGVSRDVRIHNATEEGLLEVYFPYTLTPQGSMTLAIRADSSLAPTIARVFESPKVGDMLQVASGRLIQKRLTATLIGVFAGLALTLAIVGIYGVLSFTVSRRTHEIGVRMALGAEKQAVVRMVAREAAMLAGSGVVLGVGCTLALSRLVSSLVYGSSVMDPKVYVGAAAVLFATALLAAWIPARRAAAVDPVVALRQE